MHRRTTVLFSIKFAAPPVVSTRSWTWTAFLWVLLCNVPWAWAGLDIPALQKQLDRGEALQVQEAFDSALGKRPDNAHLLYNRGLAAYAAGRFDEALVDFDRAEQEGYHGLRTQSLFQKGNAEFRLGWNARSKDPESTLARWRQSLSDYDAVLKLDAKHPQALENRTRVRKLLTEALMTNAVQRLEEGRDTMIPAEQRIPPLRSAMDQFHEASTMSPENAQAKAGEAEARDLLAAALTEEGTRKTMADRMVQPNPNEPAIMRPDTAQVQEGVNMLEDAHALKPDDQGISEKLEQGRDRLANAQTLQAQIYRALEPRIPRVDDKLGILRMGMELVEKALEQRPNHAGAKATLEQIKNRLAQIHEQEGDQMTQQAENAPLDQQARQLSQALDHFQQADGLRPDQPRIQQKAKDTQARLEQSLEQLGNKLMQDPGKEESLEEQLQRMQGAEQVLTELQSLKPSDQTAEKARLAGSEAGRLRQMLADQASKDATQPGRKGSATRPTPSQPSSLGSMPMDSPPKLDTPGVRSAFQSRAMNRGIRDY